MGGKSLYISFVVSNFLEQNLKFGLVFRSVGNNENKWAVKYTTFEGSFHNSKKILNLCKNIAVTAINCVISLS